MRKAKAHAKMIKELASYPDAKKHQIVSFIKSTLRLVGYGLLLVDLNLAVGTLVFSELLGIVEELV